MKYGLYIAVFSRNRHFVHGERGNIELAYRRGRKSREVAASVPARSAGRKVNDIRVVGRNERILVERVAVGYYFIVAAFHIEKRYIGIAEVALDRNCEHFGGAVEAPARKFVFD